MFLNKKNLPSYYCSQSHNDPQEDSQIWLEEKYENKTLKHSIIFSTTSLTMCGDLGFI
jgi:hypothetical protein